MYNITDLEFLCGKYLVPEHQIVASILERCARVDLYEGVSSQRLFQEGEERVP